MIQLVSQVEKLLLNGNLQQEKPINKLKQATLRHESINKINLVSSRKQQFI